MRDRIAIIHHSDADGFCSALITAKAIEKLVGRKPVVVQPFEYGNKKHYREAVRLIEKKKANKLIVLDIGVDSSFKRMENAFPFTSCLVIDHHKQCRDLNSEKTVFLKAEFFSKKDPSAYVSALFAFDLFNKVSDVSECDWLACIGILGDMSLHSWQQFVQKTIERKGISMTLLYALVDLIAAVEVLAINKLNELFWFFYNAENPSKVLESPFIQLLEQFKKEKNAFVDGFAAKAEFFPEIELFFYPLRRGHENIKSYVANEISEMHPSKTIILLQYPGNGRVHFSARRKDGKIKVNDLLVKAIEGIPNSSAGGHAPAAAGSIAGRYVGRFKENIVRELRKKYRK